MTHFTANLIGEFNEGFKYYKTFAILKSVRGNHGCPNKRRDNPTERDP